MYFLYDLMKPFRLAQWRDIGLQQLLITAEFNITYHPHSQTIPNISGSEGCFALRGTFLPPLDLENSNDQLKQVGSYLHCSKEQTVKIQYEHKTIFMWIFYSWMNEIQRNHGKLTRALHQDQNTPTQQSLYSNRLISVQYSKSAVIFDYISCSISHKTAIQDLFH